MHKLSFNFTSIFRTIAIALAISYVFSQFFTGSAQAGIGINRQVNFQGKLVNNPSSTNVSDTSYTVIFTFYDNASGGTQLWQETQTVTTVDGIFRVALGSVTPFPANFNFNWSGLYLGIKVNADSEMTPRIQMAAVPFAFNSEKVSGLTVQDTSGNASTSGTLQIANAKTINLGTQNLTFTTSGDTTLTLPTSGTLLTNTATAVQTVTSTQTTGTVLGVADSSALSGALTGFNIALTSSTNSQNKTGIAFDLSGGSSGTYYDLLGTGSTWSITRAGLLSVASCTGCGAPGGGGSNWTLDTTNGVLSPNNNTLDFLLGGTATTSAQFGVLGLNRNQAIATVSGKLIVQPNNGWGGMIGIGTNNPTSYLTISAPNTGAANAIELTGNTRSNAAGIKFNYSPTAGSFTGIDFSTNIGAANIRIKTDLATITSGSVISDTSSSTNVGSFTGYGINFSPTRNIVSVGTIGTDTGNFLRLAKTNVVNDSTSVLNVIGAVASISSNCTITSGNCVDTSNLLYLRQDFGKANGAVFNLVNSGVGSASAILSNSGGQAAFQINKTGNAGDILTASSSGTAKFALDLSGNLIVAGGAALDTGSGLGIASGTLGIGNTNATGITIGNNGTTAGLTFNVDTAANYTFQKEGAAYSCSGTDKLTLNGSGQMVCATDQNTGGSGGSNWTLGAGFLTPNNSTVDLLIGGQATTSAKFAVLGVNDARGSQVATLSGDLVLDKAGSIQTTNMQTLTLGGSSTGDMTLTPRNGIGTVFIPSTLANGTRTSAVLDITQSSGTDFDSTTTGLVRIVNDDTGSNAPLIYLDQNDSSGTGIQFAAGIISGSLITGTAPITGKVLDITASGLTSGTVISLAGSASGPLTDLTGDYISVAPVKTLTSGISTDTGNFLELSRLNTVNGSSSVYNMLGAVASISSNCTITSGNCVDTSNLLYLRQDFGKASGAVFNILNNGVGSAAAILSNSGGQSILILDKAGNAGDIFTASAGGQTKFALDITGQLKLAGGQTSDIDTLSATTLRIGATNATTLYLSRSGQNINLPNLGGQDNAVLYADSGSANLNAAATSTGGLCLISSGAGPKQPSWGSCGGAPAGGGSNWTLSDTDGTLSPNNNTVDLLIGGTSTDSAKFAVLGVATSTPIASIAGNLVLGSPVGTTRTIGTTAMNNLQLGDSNTGGVYFFSSANKLTSVGALTLAGASNLGGNLNFTGTNPSITNTGSNTLTINSGSTGNIQLFSASNTLSSAGTLTLAGNISAGGTTGLTLSGNAAGIVFSGTGISTISTALNQHLALNPAGTGLVGINTDGIAPLANFDVRANVGTIAIASVSGRTSYAAFVVDNAGNAGQGDLFTASASGATRFVIAQNGTVTIGTSTDGLVFNPIGGGPTYSGNARPSKTITLSPEYSGAVLTASGSANTTGSMTSDASHSANFRTYYEWSSTSTSLQDYTVAVRVTLPQDFGAWNNSTSMQISYNTDSNVAATNKLDVFIYNPSTSASTPVAYRQTNVSTSWTTVNIANTDFEDSPTWSTAGQTAMIYLKMYGSGTVNKTRVGDIVLNYKSKF